MDVLRMAVVDITTLVASCHALRAGPREGEFSLEDKLRGRIRRELKRGTVAYIGTLARAKRGVVDEALLATCRTAAERDMKHAIAHQPVLRSLMANEAGSLDGFAAARQDLWRLVHMTVYLRAGMADLLHSADAKSAIAQSGRLRRRLRKALIAYARAMLSAKPTKAERLGRAREAALAEIGKRGTADAEWLAAIEADAQPPRTVIRLGVAKPLSDLALDWQRTAVQR